MLTPRFSIFIFMFSNFPVTLFWFVLRQETFRVTSFFAFFDVLNVSLVSGQF